MSQSPHSTIEIREISNPRGHVAFKCPLCKMFCDSFYVLKDHISGTEGDEENCLDKTENPKIVYK